MPRSFVIGSAVSARLLKVTRLLVIECGVAQDFSIALWKSLAQQSSRALSC